MSMFFQEEGLSFMRRTLTFSQKVNYFYSLIAHSKPGGGH